MIREVVGSQATPFCLESRIMSEGWWLFQEGNEDGKLIGKNVTVRGDGFLSASKKTSLEKGVGFLMLLGKREDVLLLLMMVVGVMLLTGAAALVHVELRRWQTGGCS